MELLQRGIISMQYKSYTIQPFRYGVIVRDIHGNYVTQCANDAEAMEYIDSICE